MPSFSATLCLFSFVALVAALSSPHAARNIHHHRSIAARVAAPDLGIASIRRRQNKRCKTRTSSSSSSSTPPAVNVAPTPTITQATTTTTSTTSTSSSSSSSYSAPPSSPVAAAPQPKASSTSSSAPAPSSSSVVGSALSYLTGIQTGQGTFYATGLGACGITNTDTDYIAAVSELLFDTYPGYNGINPNTNPVCNKKITATYQGKSVSITVTDRCTACAITDLDFSPTAFDTLSDPGVGRISGMTWVWA